MSPVVTVERILLTLWVGSLWAIGYMAAPVLFKLLEDRSLAGNLAGEMFHIVSYVGIICGGFLIAMSVRRGTNWRLWVLLTMLVLVICGEFVLQPMMQELKAIGLLEGSAEKARFGVLHVIASSLYLINSLLGLTLVIFGLHRPTYSASRD